MNLKPIELFIIMVSLLISNQLFSQSNKISIQGQIIDELSQEPISFVTVLIVEVETNENISGTTTDDEGKFNLKVNSGNFFVEASFIGYETKKIDLTNKSLDVIDIGIIFLKKSDQVLEEVELRAEKSSTEFKLDRRIFNVGKDLSTTGMGALEVLNNVPSVNVSIEGEVSLRGNSGVQILIDGKPSILADDPSNMLSSITADMIDRIEVITNPSAKYDAEGTAGILNIILKKEEKEGMNGSVTLNTGIPHNHSVGFSLNKRTEKFNLFTQLGLGYRSLPSDSENSNQDLVNNTIVNSKGTAYRNEIFYNITLGTDYYITPLDVVTLSGNYAYEIEDQPSNYDFRYFDSSEDLLYQWNRDETTEATNPKWQYELQYKKDFEDHEDHELLFSVSERFFGKDQESEFIVTNIFGDRDSNDQQTETEFQQAEYTFKLDYTKPITDKISMELGSQYVINDVGNDYTVRDLINGDWVTNHNLTNNFEYDQKVLGVYGAFSFEGKAWGVKGGLRLENTDLKTILTNTNEENSQKYTDFFPSAHFSYNLSDITSFQAGYSTRIFRPRLWDLNPFFNIRNDFNIRNGNPYLKPEYTDSFELTSIFVFEKISLNTGLYYLYTTDVVERVTTFDDNVSTTTPQNVGTNNRTGVEVNFKYNPINWLTLSGDFNYGFYKRFGTYEEQSFDFNGDRWSSRLTGKFKFPANFELELIGNHQSEYQTVQSVVSKVTFADLGLRKKIAKGKLVINFSVRDLFNSRNREVVTSQPEFYVYSNGSRGRFFTLGLSYGFGKGEAMSYSGRRR